MSLTAADIIAVTTSVTKKWEKQRKAEERGIRSRWSRDHVYSDRVDFTGVAEESRQRLAARSRRPRRPEHHGNKAVHRPA